MRRQRDEEGCDLLTYLVSLSNSMLTRYNKRSVFRSGNELEPWVQIGGRYDEDSSLLDWLFVLVVGWCHGSRCYASSCVWIMSLPSALPFAVSSVFPFDVPFAFYDPLLSSYSLCLQWSLLHSMYCIAFCLLLCLLPSQAACLLLPFDLM